MVKSMDVRRGYGTIIIIIINNSAYGVVDVSYAGASVEVKGGLCHMGTHARSLSALGLVEGH